MQRVGLLTLPLHSNYGGIIQAAALYALLQEFGHHPVLLRKAHNRVWWKRAIVEVLKWLPGQNLANFRNQHLKLQRHAKFIDEFLPGKSRLCYSDLELKAECDRLGVDTVVVGSDQVWRLDYIDDGFYDSYFLSFLEGSMVRRISYAASFGTDRWTDEYKVAAVSRLLSGFSAVSVREDSGIALCAEYFGCEGVAHVLDPTLLIDRSFHESVVAALATGRAERGLYAYVLDGSAATLAVVEAVQRSERLSKVIVAAPEVDLAGYVNMGEWLCRFRDAEFVVTDSYHGMIFSIVFEKQFVAVGNIVRGLTRFKSLLTLLGLQDRLIEAVEGEVHYPSGVIDYVVVNQRLAELRRDSRDFLAAALARGASV